VIERSITGWEGVCAWRVAILTTQIPSALLVEIMWLQRTWRPRFRHGTFSYGITTSPNTRDRVKDIENTACVCTLVPQGSQMHMLCKCMLKKGHNYIFITFKRLWARPWGISSWLHVRSNQDKDINTKNILVLQHVWGQGVGGKILVDGNDMMIGESLLKIEF
jgi:hypothetical protein